MKKSLYFNEVILVGLLTFGLFFGAGNLIFPVLLGQMAGDNLWTASFGFLCTAVILPVVGIISAVVSKSEDVYDMAVSVCKPYAMFFSILLYL